MYYVLHTMFIHTMNIVFIVLEQAILPLTALKIQMWEKNPKNVKKAIPTYVHGQDLMPRVSGMRLC